MLNLTTDDLWELAELAWAHADRNDDDEEYYQKYNTLFEKVQAIIAERKANANTNN